jgi:two-component system chemotaxis response regulator CheB
VALQTTRARHKLQRFGELSAYACPDCKGVLAEIKEGGLTRYRCHTGHAYSADSLLAAITENVEESLWNAIRSIEESMLLLNEIGDLYASRNEPGLAAAYFQKAIEADERRQLIRSLVLVHEQLSTDSLNTAGNTPSREHKKQPLTANAANR